MQITNLKKNYIKEQHIQQKCRLKTMRNLLGHNCKVTALPESIESWFTGLDSILPGEVKSREYVVKRKIKYKRLLNNCENKTTDLLHTTENSLITFC